MLVGLAALFLILHGLVHLVGFMLPWRFAGIKGLDADRAAGGRLHLSAGAARTLGLLWLLVAVLFVTAALGLLFEQDWAPGLIIVAALGSLPLCLSKLPEMAVGAILDVVILVIVVPVFFAGSPTSG